MFTNIAFVIQICQPQEQKTFCFDSQWGSGWHINDNEWRERYLPYYYSSYFQFILHTFGRIFDIWPLTSLSIFFIERGKVNQKKKNDTQILLL